jgi:hypothetical protein
MAKGLSILSGWTGRCLVIGAALLSAILVGRAQSPTALPPLPDNLPPTPHVQKEQLLVEQYPESPSLTPEFTIPVGPLGFSAPGAFYLLRRQSLVSLDFLDEDRLLFSFQVPQLMHRDNANDAETKERQIRAVVVALPGGKIEAEAQWVVADRSRYLWMLKDGHFLLRDSDGLEQGDAALKITPYLRLPGRLLWLTLDPAQQVLVTNSVEPADATQKPDDAANPAAAQSATSADQQTAAAQQTLVVRTMKRESGELITMTRVPWTNQASDWPINSEGYVENSKGNGRQWMLNLKTFADVVRVVGSVNSACPPTSDFLSEQELLVATCDPGGGRLVAMSASGSHVWEQRRFSNVMWPLLTTALDGSRTAREILVLKRTTNRYKRPIGASELVGQMLTVLNTADGKVMLEAPLSPVFDGGGNVAVSPSGRRVAVINAGAIQVFDLGAPARSPDAGTKP